jgi:HEAT repeat protein
MWRFWISWGLALLTVVSLAGVPPQTVAEAPSRKQSTREDRYEHDLKRLFGRLKATQAATRKRAAADLLKKAREVATHMERLSGVELQGAEARFMPIFNHMWTMQGQLDKIPYEASHPDIVIRQRLVRRLLEKSDEPDEAPLFIGPRFCGSYDLQPEEAVRAALGLNPQLVADVLEQPGFPLRAGLLRNLFIVDPMRAGALAEAWASDPVPRVRFEARRILSSVKHPTLLSLIERGLDDPDAALRAQAVAELPTFATDWGASRVSQMLRQDRHPWVRSVCARTLCTLKDRGSVAILLAALEDESEDVRSSVATNVGDLLTENDLPKIASLLQNPSKLSWSGALRILRLMDSRPALDLLLGALKTAPADRLLEVCQALQGKTELAVVQAVTPLLDSADKNVQREVRAILEAAKEKIPPP